jgi:hypothetical protein
MRHQTTELAARALGATSMRGIVVQDRPPYSDQHRGGYTTNPIITTPRASVYHLYWMLLDSLVITTKEAIMLQACLRHAEIPPG